MLGWTDKNNSFLYNFSVINTLLHVQYDKQTTEKFGVLRIHVVHE